MRYPALVNPGSSVWTINLQRGPLHFCFSTSCKECCEYDDFCEILAPFGAFSLMWCCAVLMDSLLPVFQQCMAFPSSWIKMSTLHICVCVRVCVCVCVCAHARACVHAHIHTVLCKLWQKGNQKCGRENRTGYQTIIRLVFLWGCYVHWVMPWVYVLMSEILYLAAFLEVLDITTLTV